MARVSTSIKIDNELWKEFKKHCIDKDIEVSVLLERLVREDLALQTQRTAPTDDRLLALAKAYEALIEKHGAENVDRYHKYLQAIAEQVKKK